jgi:cell division septum initiation protein DivIVA
MIHSSSVEGHHFLPARRRGYDPTEVDAVIKRLVTALRVYEERDEATATEASVTDLESARLARGRLEDITEETAELRRQAVAQFNEAQLRSEQLLATAEEQADHIVETARADAASLVARRNDRSEALITSALSEVKALRARTLRETNDYHAAKRAEAASLVQTARLTAEELLEDARHEAGSILGRARREHAALETRLAQLRSAIAGIEGQFRHLAESTLEQTEIMASMISLETNELEDVIEEKSPDVVRLTQPGMTIDLTDNAAAAPVAPAHTEERFAVAPGNTIYQRRGGGLRRRLEEGEIAERRTESAEDTAL